MHWHYIECQKVGKDSDHKQGAEEGTFASTRGSTTATATHSSSPSPPRLSSSKAAEKDPPAGGGRGAGKQYGVIVKMLDKKSEYKYNIMVMVMVVFF